MPHIAIYHSVMIVLLQGHQGTMCVEVVMVDLAKIGLANAKGIAYKSGTGSFQVISALQI